ncbi:MAG TPA: CapA family protein, partial [Spirochaetia bacterium]|nr:CapA family protein [Spirochaetia bacterium]
MNSLTKLLTLFIVGLIIGSLWIITKPLPISSRLPELFFPDTSDSSVLTIVFTGDVMLGRSVNTRIQKYADPTWPFKNIASILSEADVSIINLESPFITGCRSTDKGMIFCADPKSVFGLVFAGIDVATLANNHINNQGQKGIDETISILKNNNIIPIGLGKPVFNTVKKTKLAYLGFSDFPQIEDKEIIDQILEATKSADLIITSFHWGVEYQKNPTSRQIYLAHLAIDSGADIVVGHHPHWTQTEETYQGKPIFYSLGNLVFD